MNPENDTDKFLLRRSVEVVEMAVLETWETAMLLKRLKRLQKCMKTTDGRDLTDDKLREVGDRILLKTDSRWTQAYEDVKSLLVTREHVDRPGEAKKKRKSKKQRRTVSRPKRAPKATEASETSGPD